MRSKIVFPDDSEGRPCEDLLEKMLVWTVNFSLTAWSTFTRKLPRW